MRELISACVYGTLTMKVSSFSILMTLSSYPFPGPRRAGICHSVNLLYDLSPQAPLPLIPMRNRVKRLSRRRFELRAQRVGNRDECDLRDLGVRNPEDPGRLLLAPQVKGRPACAEAPSTGREHE